MPGAREMARRARADLRFLLALRQLPPPVARLQWRARRQAIRSGDDFSLVSATRPRKLAWLLRVARGRREVVELGTATAWTTLSLLVAEPDRQLRSFDPHPHPRRGDYLSLVDDSVRRRATFIAAPGRAASPSSAPVELLYIDSSHERVETVQEVQAWWPYLAADAVIAFDDYDHPSYPGVRDAVQELGLAGEARDGLWIHRREASGAEAGENPT